MKIVSILLLVYITPMVFSQFFTEFGPSTTALFVSNFAHQLSNLKDTLETLGGFLDMYKQGTKSIRHIANIPAELKKEILGYVDNGKSLVNQLYYDVNAGWEELEEIQEYYSRYLDYDIENIPQEFLAERMEELESMLNDVGYRVGQGIEGVKNAFERSDDVKRLLEEMKYIADSGSTIAALEGVVKMLANIAEGINEIEVQLSIQGEELAIGIEQRLLDIKAQAGFDKVFEDVEAFNPFNVETDSTMPDAWFDMLPDIPKFPDVIQR